MAGPELSLINPNSLLEIPSRVAEFQVALDKVRQTAPEVIDMDAVLKIANQNNDKSLTDGCINVIKDKLSRSTNPEKFYVHSKEIGKTLRLDSLLVSRTTSGETSKHGVFFGALGSGSNMTRVAIKPFEDNPNKAVKEWVNTMLVGSKGLDTFSPLGFMIIGTTGFLLTKRQRGVEAMDNVDWSMCLMEPKQNRAMLEDIMKIGPALARLHHKGIAHNDPQLKNCVITQSGSVHFNDWESANIFNPRNFPLNSYIQEEKARSIIKHDLLSLFGSLAKSTENYGVGLLDRLTLTAQFSLFNELVLTPYIEERLALITANSVHVDEDSVIYHIGMLEQELREYILNGEIYKSSSVNHDNADD